MLANALALAALLAVLGAAVVEAGFAAAKTTLLLRAQSVLQSGITHGSNAAVNAIAAQIQTGGALVPAPAFTPLPAVCADAACGMTVTETITPGNAPARAAAPNLETNGYVAELRIALRIEVTVTAQGGRLARRTHDIVVRETLSPPYASIAGVVGGDAGRMQATPVPCSSAAPGSSDGTVVRAEYRQ
ncbi:MAG TPA: hypothetical protein VFL13_06645, partial [Candidatus Baltobacteraceae bacterium]|nr:hypothetical protein [Candidatus Baltobacteraceae bacterium]